MLKPHLEKIILCPFKLTFDNTNNSVEYEAPLLGIKESKRRGLKILKAHGDYKPIVKQVKDVFSMKKID